MALLTERWIYDVIILLSTAFFLAYLHVTRYFDYWKKRGVPFLKPIPFFGNLIDLVFLRKQMGTHLADMYNKIQAPFFGMFFLDQPSLMLKDPELIKAVLIKDFNNFCDRNMLADEACDSISANFLFTIKNPEWKLMRNRLTPMFSRAKIKNMFGLVNEVAEDMIKYMNDSSQSERVIDMREVSGKFTTDIIASTGFGINANSFKDENAEFRRVSREMLGFNLITSVSQLCFFFFHNLVRIFHLKFFPDNCTGFLRTALWKTIREREKSGIIRHDFVDVVIDIRKNETIQDTLKFDGDKVIGQAVLFFAAGFETTSTTLLLTVYELGCHREIQERLRKEIINCVQSRDGFNYEAIHDMKYLEMVVSEALRKHPVLSFVDRETTNDYQIPGTKVIITKGVSVYVPVYGLHYDPLYYPEPEKFDPERFTAENKKTRPACTYIPFGDGPRQCLGLQLAMLMLKVGVAQILLEFDLEATPTNITYSPANFLLNPTSKLNVQFKKRQ